MDEPIQEQPRQWACTFFPSQAAQTLESGYFSKQTLEDAPVRRAKSRLPWLKLARFSGELNPDSRSDYPALRYDAGVSALSGAEGDYDEGELSPEKAADKLQAAGITGFIYTTPSHGQPGKGNRWRVLLPFSVEFVGNEADMRSYRANALKRAEEVVGVAFATESYTLSQAYYYGEVEGVEFFYLETDGRCIDELYTLGDTPTPAANTLLDALSASAAARHTDFDLAAAVRRVVTGEDFHGSLRSIYGHYAALGVPLESAITMARELMAQAAGADSRWQERFDDIERVAADIYRKEETKNTAPACSLDDLITEFEVTDEDVGNMKETQMIFRQFIAGGHMIAIVGLPGSGKTTVMEAIAPQLPGRVVYVNADISSGDIPEARRRAATGGYALLCPDVKEGKSMSDVVQRLRGINASGADLSDIVFIIDTLKKMTDMINKKLAAGVYELIRQLTAKGATVICLGHCNKHRDPDGWPIYEGTSDLRSDFDELVLLHGLKGDYGIVTTSLYWQEQGWPTAKARIKVEPLSWEIDTENGRATTLLDHWVNTVEEEKQKKKAARMADLIEAIAEYLGRNPDANQSKIQDAMKAAHGADFRATTTALKLEADVRWTRVPGENNSFVHRLITLETRGGLYAPSGK